LSFAGLTPDQIRSGLSVLGRLVAARSKAPPGASSRRRDGVRRKPCLIFERTVSIEGWPGEMLKGGVIMDVTNAEQARLPKMPGLCGDGAGARAGGYPQGRRVARMANIGIMEAIMRTVHIPVMAKARIGHFMEARILEALGVDYIDESEVLTPADEEHHIAKSDFKVPFVCGARNLGEALRRIAEGAAMIRTKARPARATSSRPCATSAPS